MNNSLIEQKMIENLLLGRNKFINTYCTIMELQAEMVQTGFNIDKLIPTDNAGYIDDFNSVICAIPARLGESIQNRRIPKEQFNGQKTKEEIRKIVTQAVDGAIWDMLFNRLGIFGYMSTEQKSNFRDICKKSPQEFTLDNVTATLSALYSNREGILLDSLVDTFTGLSSFYVSNDTCKFNKKVIIEDAFNDYGNTYKLTLHSPLQNLLGVIWRWVLCHKLAFTEKGVDVNEIWNELDTILAQSGGDIDEIRRVEVVGIEFRFFLKKTVHVIFPESMISLLNDQLAKTNSLAKF